MNTLTRFFNTIKDSFYSPTFYAGMHGRSVGGAVGYFVLLSLICTLLAVAFEAGRVTDGVKTFRDEYVTGLIASYPQDLEITLKNGVISSNKQGEYAVPLAEALRGQDAERRANLVVVNTSEKFSVEKWQQADTRVWVGSDAIAFEDNKGLKVEPASKFPEGTLTRGKIDALYARIAPFIDNLPLIALLGVGVFFFTVFVLNLLWALLLAVVVLIIAHNLRKPFTYADAYKTTVYAMTLGLLYLLLERFGLTHIPLVFSLIPWVVAFATLKGTEPPAASAPTTA